MNKLNSLNHPRVSVLVPVYNTAEYIEETLLSIISQDYQNIEILVSDDASKDCSVEVVEKLRRIYPSKIHLFKNEQNVGVAANMNKLLSKVTGEYICLFAGDDVMLPGKISKQVSVMQGNPDVVMTYHPVEIFQTETGRTLQISGSSRRNDTNSAADIIKKLGISGGGMSIMLRRDAVPPEGFNESLKFVNDWLFQIDVAARGSVLKLDEVLCKYRKYGSNNGKNLNLYLWEFDRVLDIVSEKYRANKEISKAVNIGRARFYAGEGFRQLETDTKNARAWFTKAIRLAPCNLFYIAGLFVSIFPYAPEFIFKHKYLIKKLLAK